MRRQTATCASGKYSLVRRRLPIEIEDKYEFPRRGFRGCIRSVLSCCLPTCCKTVSIRQYEYRSRFDEVDDDEEEAERLGIRELVGQVEENPLKWLVENDAPAPLVLDSMDVKFTRHAFCPMCGSVMDRLRPVTCAFACGVKYCSAECCERDHDLHVLSIRCRSQQLAATWMTRFMAGQVELCHEMILEAGPDVLVRLQNQSYVLLWTRVLAAPVDGSRQSWDIRRRLIGNLIDAGLPVANLLVNENQSLLGFIKTCLWQDLVQTSDMDQQTHIKAFWAWLEPVLTHHGALSEKPPWRITPEFTKRECELRRVLDMVSKWPSDLLGLIVAFDLESMAALCLEHAKSGSVHFVRNTLNYV